MQLANWGSILSTRELSCGIKLRSIYNKISVELYNPQFMAHQFGVTSHPSLSAEQVKKLTHLTQWLLNLFEFHLFQFDPKKTLNFLNQWPYTMVLFCLMISYAAAAAVIYPGQQHGRPRLWKSSTGKFKYLLPVKAENTSAGSPCFRLWSVFQEMGFLFERFFQLHGSEFQEIYMLLDEKDNTLNSISL